MVKKTNTFASNTNLIGNTELFGRSPDKISEDTSPSIGRKYKTLDQEMIVCILSVETILANLLFFSKLSFLFTFNFSNSQYSFLNRVNNSESGGQWNIQNSFSTFLIGLNLRA